MTGQKRKRILLDKGIKQVEIARECDVTAAHVSMVVSGAHVSWPVAEAIAKRADLPVLTMFPALRFVAKAA